MGDILPFKKFEPNNTTIGDIIFSTAEYENILVLNSNGDIFIKGNLVENDIQIVDILREICHNHIMETK